MLTVTISKDLDSPVYEQIAGQIRRLISAGKLTPGMALPSVRQLASDLGVGLNTVARAYQVLGVEGFLAIRDRSGAVVAPPAEAVDDAVRAHLLEQMFNTLARLKQTGVPADELLRIVREATLPHGRE